jgi:hypothetical protein
VTEPSTILTETAGLGSTDPGPLSASDEAWTLEADESDDPTERHTWPDTWMRAALLALCATVIAGVVGCHRLGNRAAPQRHSHPSHTRSPASTGGDASGRAAKPFCANPVGSAYPCPERCASAVANGHD